MSRAALLLLLIGQVDPRAEVLTLDQAIEIAQEYTNEVVRAESDLLLLDVERARAIGLILPSVNFSLAAGASFGGDPVTETRDPRNLRLNRFEAEGDFTETFFRPAFTLRQLVFDGGRWWLILARTRDMKVQREATLEVVRNDVRLNVVRQFYNLERSERAVETFRGQMKVSEDQLERARALFEAGGKKSDVATAQRNLAEDRVQLARREFAADEARRNLNLAMGRDSHLPLRLILPPHVATATAAKAELSLPVPHELVEVALTTRPEIVRSKASLEILQKNIGIRAADYWPRLTVGGSYRKGWYGIGNRDFFDAFDTPPDRNYFIVLDATLTFNLFDGFQNEADVQEAEIALRRARSDHENLERVVAREVHSRLQNLGLQLAVYDLARDAAQSADEAVRLARVLFNQGKGTALELRDAELRFTQSKLQAINARLDVEVAIEELRRAVGRPVSLE